MYKTKSNSFIVFVILLCISFSNGSAQNNFDVDRAVAYAELFWGDDEFDRNSPDNYNFPEYGYWYGSDCANYSSQLMHAGGAGFCQDNSWSPDFDGWANNLDDYYNEYGEDGRGVAGVDSDNNVPEPPVRFHQVIISSDMFGDWFRNVHDNQWPRDWTVHGPIGDIADMEQIGPGWFGSVGSHCFMINGGTGANATYTAHTNNRIDGQLRWYNDPNQYDLYLFQDDDVSPKRIIWIRPKIKEVMEFDQNKSLREK